MAVTLKINNTHWATAVDHLPCALRIDADGWWLYFLTTAPLSPSVTIASHSPTNGWGEILGMGATFYMKITHSMTDREHRIIAYFFVREQIKTINLENLGAGISSAVLSAVKLQIPSHCLSQAHNNTALDG